MARKRQGSPEASNDNGATKPAPNTVDVPARARKSGHGDVPHVPRMLLGRVLWGHPLPSPYQGPAVVLPIDVFTGELLRECGGTLRPGPQGFSDNPFERVRRGLLWATGEADEYVSGLERTAALSDRAATLAGEAERLAKALSALPALIADLRLYTIDLNRAGALLHGGIGESLVVPGLPVENLDAWAKKLRDDAKRLKPPRADSEAWRVGFALGLGRVLRDLSDIKVSRNETLSLSFPALLGAGFETLLRLTLELRPGSFDIDSVMESVDWTRSINSALSINKAISERHFEYRDGWWNSSRTSDSKMPNDYLDLLVFDIDDSGQQQEAAPRITRRERNVKEWRLAMRDLHRRAGAGDERARRNLMDERSWAQELKNIDAILFLDGLADGAS